MATNASDAADASLPDELLLDIFARLSAEPIDLLHCVGTCARWLHLLAADDAAFLRRAGVLPESKNATILLGAFYQNDWPVVHGLTATLNMIPHGPPRFRRLDDLARPGLGLFSKHDGLFNYAKPLASRRGLLLVRLMPAPIDYRKLHLAVCHPLLGGVHHVPPPPVHLQPPYLGTDQTGYSLVTGYGGEGLDSRRQRRLAFRVLFTAVRLDGVVDAYSYSYSSATGSWSAPTMCPLQLRNLVMSGPRAGVVDGCGTTHWLYRDTLCFYTLDVSADAARVSLTKIPIPVEGEHDRRLMPLQPPFPCIAQGGKLSFVFVRRLAGSMLNICHSYQYDNNQGWIHNELPIFHMPVESFITSALLSFKIIGFVETRGALLVKSYFGMFFLDLEVLELIKGSEYSTSTYPREGCPSSMCQGYNSCVQCAHNNCVLYELDWSSYLLHLSAWSPRGTTW